MEIKAVTFESKSRLQQRQSNAWIKVKSDIDIVSNGTDYLENPVYSGIDENLIAKYQFQNQADQNQSSALMIGNLDLEDIEASSYAPNFIIINSQAKDQLEIDIESEIKQSKQNKESSLVLLNNQLNISPELKEENMK